MQKRGDLIQLIINLFQETDPLAAKSLADRIGLLAHEAINSPSPEVPSYELTEVEQRSTLNRPRPLAVFDDRQLAAFNSLLPWGAMTGDDAGRVVGAAWSDKKRSRIQPLVDSRISDFDAVYPLAGRHVLEVGCFEGIHTIGCLSMGARVTAVDARMENMLKTLARVWVYGFQADVQAWDLEAVEPPSLVPQQWDMLHHMGVLYHLTNPAEHLALALDRTGSALMLDTHVADDADHASESYQALGRKFAFARQGEGPVSPFAGMRDHAKWLLIEDLEWICRDRGFTDVSVREVRNEQNGRRVLIWAFRPGVRDSDAS